MATEFTITLTVDATSVDRFYRTFKRLVICRHYGARADGCRRPRRVAKKIAKRLSYVRHHASADQAIERLRVEFARVLAESGHVASAAGT